MFKFTILRLMLGSAALLQEEVQVDRVAFFNGSSAEYKEEVFDEPKPCWDEYPAGPTPGDGDCNCTTCTERGGNWRYFTPPHMGRWTGGLSDGFAPPPRFCLQVDSNGHPQRPDRMRNFTWDILQNATTAISKGEQCPETLCPKLKTCSECTSGILPCTWRGPAPALQHHMQGSCMFIGDTDTFKRMTTWFDIPSMEDTESRRKCSARGLLKRNRTHNLCSNANISAHAAADPRFADCASEVQHDNAVCLRGDIFHGHAKSFDCRNECDLYGGECRGVSFLTDIWDADKCMVCLLFEDCIEPENGEQAFAVSFGPSLYGDWIFSVDKCPDHGDGCQSYRFPGYEVPPMEQVFATSYTPWYPDQKRCLQDSRCKFCTYPFPAKDDHPLPHRVEDAGCFDKNVEPYHPSGLNPDVKPYCKWDQFLGATPETACAAHTTYAACAGSAFVGCQWCFTRMPTGRFRQRDSESIMDQLVPKCVYYLDALQGCVSMKSLHAMPPDNQIPLLQLFELGKVYSEREQSCGAHQLFGNMLTMVSDNRSQNDIWYNDDGAFDVSSALDIAYIPMYVAPSDRDAQLAKLKHCTNQASLRKGGKECRQVFADTCSRCLRTPGCWWTDNGLDSRVTGDWTFDLFQNEFLPGCFSASAQQKYIATVTSLSANPTVPVRALTVPQDEHFCFDPCWNMDTCSSCLSKDGCQWCDYPNGYGGDDASFCTSVAGPYQICLDKYTRIEACPSHAPAPEAERRLVKPVQKVGSSSPSDSGAPYTSLVVSIMGLLCLPVLLVCTCLRVSSIRRRRMTKATAGRGTVLLTDSQEVSEGAGVQGMGVHSAAPSDCQHSCVNLRFQELGFRAKVGGEEKQILQGVSGSVSSGQFLAVMGPSGSGKTTFLDVLARRKLNLKACDGDVLVNGCNVEKYTRSYCGGLTEFVPQQDTMLAVHTVTESLRFVADMKLPPTMSASAKAKRVSEVITMVGLEHRASAFIGNNLVRGLSGGERRRAMIAAALVPRAPVLFLDEPTSGLSSTDSLRVVEMLGVLAKTHGYAVVAVVHQPQSRLFGHFDKLLLLSQGEVCYMGSAHESVAWFEKVAAVAMPSAMNPADWLLDIITPGFMETTDVIAACKHKVATERALAHAQKESTACDHVAQTDLLNTPEFATGRWKQFRVVAYRCFQAKVRRWDVLLVRLGVNLGVAVIAGSALPLEQPLYVHGVSGEPSRQINAVIFFVVTFQGLIALTVLPLFADDRELFAHERKARLYRVLPYFVANFSVESLVQAYSSLVFGAVFYVIVSLSHDSSRIFFYLLATVLVGDCASSFAQLCSSATRSIVGSLALCAMGLGCFLLFSGFLMLPSSIPLLWKPLYHMSFWKYGFQALTINEYAGATFPCESLNYSLAARCPPFGFSDDCPTNPCMNMSSGHAAAVHDYRRFNDLADVHNAFLTSDFAWFLGSADARQINCRMLCGPEEAPGRYEGDDCVCSSFSGCRNDTKAECDPFLWKESRNMCTETRHLNGLPANGTCASAIENIDGEYFMDTLGFGRADADGKPDPEINPDIKDARTSFVCIGGNCSPHSTKYVWLGALILIMAAFRVSNFVLLLHKCD